MCSVLRLVAVMPAPSESAGWLNAFLHVFFSGRRISPRSKSWQTIWTSMSILSSPMSANLFSKKPSSPLCLRILSRNQAR